jgi:hypothetical protein
LCRRGQIENLQNINGEKKSKRRGVGRSQKKRGRRDYAVDDDSGVLEGAVIHGWARTSSIKGRFSMSLDNIHLISPMESIFFINNNKETLGEYHFQEQRSDDVVSNTKAKKEIKYLRRGQRGRGGRG